MANEKPGRPISKDEFEKLRKNYDKNNPKKTKSVNFGKETFTRIMSHPSTETISIFYGQEDDGTDTIMLVGIDAQGRILYSTTEDKGQPCPPYCPQ